jgi:hypothetical protein
VAPTLTARELPPIPSPGRPSVQVQSRWPQPWRLAALLAQAPLAGLAIVLIGRAAFGQGDGGVPAVASALFWLGLAAVWFGLSDAVFGSPGKEAVGSHVSVRRGAAHLLIQFGVLGALCVVQCLLAWALVAAGVGLKGPGLPALVLLILASAVGLTIGLGVVLLAPRTVPAWAFLPMVILPFWLLGGQTWPIPQMPSWAALSANAVPSRWVFEGLLLLEAGQGPRTPDANDDPAESFFPAESVRMGPRADMLALLAMLIGLTAAVAFIAEGPRPAS